MANMDDVPVEVTSNVETLDEVDVASAESENVVTEFSTKTWRDDLTLVVDDRRLYVSKVVLSFASPVFDAMFTSEFQEKNKEEIALPGKTFEDFVEFLKCFYPGIMKPVTMDNVFKVLPLANEYQVQTLKSACEVCLLNHLSTTLEGNEIYAVLAPACTYDLEQAKAKCIDIITQRPVEEFDNAVSRTSYPDDVLNKIRNQFLHALNTKHRELCCRMKTSEILNRYLGEMSCQRDVVNKYLDGKVVGDYVQMKVDAQYNAIANLHIGEIRFSVSLSQYYRDVDMKIECQTQRSIQCLTAVFIQNWMEGKGDKRQTSTIKFSDRKATNTIRLSDFNCTSLEEEAAGFVYRGTMDFSVYLFCIDE